MRILHLSPCLWPAWGCGDVALRVWLLARAQARLGHEVGVLTTDCCAPHERTTSGTSFEDGISVTRLRTRHSSSRWLVGLTWPIGFRAALAAHLREAPPDAVHAHELLTWELARAASRLPTSSRLIVSPHAALRTVPLAPGALRLWRMAGGMRAARRVDTCLCDTPGDAAAAAALFHRLGVPPPPMVPLALGPTGWPPMTTTDATGRVPDAWSLAADAIVTRYARPA